jgi:S1-C subfamily serine protease
MVVGVNTANIPFAQGIGFAIPINSARKIAKEIIEHGRVMRPYVGLAGLSLTREIAQSYDIPYDRGVLVIRVGRGSPAHSSGITRGDVILEVDKQALKSWEDLQHLLHDKKVGDNLEMLIGREGQQHRVTLTLQEAAS